MKYDDASWHYGAEGFSEPMASENAATHIGFYIAWIIHQNLISDFHATEHASLIQQVRARKITGRTYFFACCDEKFTSDDLNETGQQFTGGYYEMYMTEIYGKLADKFGSVYSVPDTWANYDLIEPQLNDLYKDWESETNDSSISGRIFKWFARFKL